MVRFLPAATLSLVLAFGGGKAGLGGRVTRTHRPGSSGGSSNAAWVACAIMASNLARAAAVAAGLRTARWSTLRTRIISIPGRVGPPAANSTLHLPSNWAWNSGWEQLWAAGTGPPCAGTT